MMPRGGFKELLFLTAAFGWAMYQLICALFHGQIIGHRARYVFFATDPISAWTSLAAHIGVALIFGGGLYLWYVSWTRWRASRPSLDNRVRGPAVAGQTRKTGSKDADRNTAADFDHM
jgi:hypothetical protein